MWFINDLRDFDSIDLTLFKKRIYVSKIRKYELYKTETDNSVKYGVYHDDLLVSYIWFTKQPAGLMTYEFHTRDNYKNKGLGYDLYKFIMTGEKKIIITDHLCTKSGYKIWEKLKQDSDIGVGMIDTMTDKITPIDESLFGNDNYHMVAWAC